MPIPTAEDVGKVLEALGANSYGWRTPEKDVFAYGSAHPRS